MDYLIFLIGLFLLTAGAGGFFLYREHGQLSRWPLLGIALITLCFKIWFGIVVFAVGLGNAEILIQAALGSLYATSMLGFCLSPLVEGPRPAFVLKWAAMVGMFGLTFLKGIGSLESAWFVGPILIASLWAGWKIAGFLKKLFTWKKSISPVGTSLLLTFITAVCLHPRAVAISYDVLGEGHAAPRLAVLAALAGATIAGMILCFLLWSPIYQKNRNQLTRNLLRRRKIGTSVILVAAVFAVANGAWLARWLGGQAEREQTGTLLSALQLATEIFDVRTIESIRGNEEEIGNASFNFLRSKLLSVRKAMPGSRFAYLMGMRDRKLVFLVDAEDPSKTDTFSPPGEPVADYPEKWQPELAGKSTFNGPDRDEWGVWFSASVPVLDRNQKVAALLGVDFPATEWLRPLAGKRLAAMGVTLSVALLLIALFGIHLSSIETTWRVEGLSESLSDAMTAAEFDTWECFPKPFRLKVSARFASSLGWTGKHADPSFRQVWRQIHPEDRYQVFSLVRPSKSNLGGSSEREIRLMDASGRWVWFMLRGRIIRSHQQEEVRLAGTIINIDERQRARLEIDKQRRFAQHVMESVPNGLAVIDDDGILSYVNPAFVELARGAPKSLVGKSIDSLIAVEDFSPDAGKGFEANLTCLDGTTVPVQVFRAPLSESRRNSGSILAIVDLTAAKASEQDLLRSRAEANRLALVAKRTDNAVVITDARGHIEWVNEGFTKISGYTRDEVVGKTPGSVLQRPGFRDPACDHMRECVRAGKGFDTEIVNYGKGGRAYIVHIECQPLVDSRGTLTGFMAIERDVTETRRSSNLLEAVASTSATLLAKRIDSPIWGEILEALGIAVNVERCHLFQVHTSPEIPGKVVKLVSSWNSGVYRGIQNLESKDLPFENSAFDRWYREMSAGKEIHGPVRTFPVVEQPPLLAQGVRSLIAVPIIASGELWGYLSFDACQEDRIWQNWEISILRSAAANIGLRQVAQNESDALILARDEASNAAIAAEKANRAKSTFLATMSHEIRTPLNAVIGMASILETTSLNGQQLDYAGTILSSSNFLLGLINDILDYSRIESGKIDLDSTSFSLAELCRETFDVIRPGASGKQLELIGRIAPHLPARFEGDPSRIRQILVNLLSNAVKFTQCGFVNLVVDGTLRLDGRWQLTMEVNDSGIGIAPDAIDRLFRPFVQEDSSTTRRFGGSGLGLAISKRLAEMMGGDITVRSVPGKGSSFVATVNLDTAGEAASPAAVPLLPNMQLKILVVDDNELNRRILEENLAAWGLACDTADSAAAAIRQWVQAGPYDLIITDYHMPDLDGVEMTRYFRSLPDASQTRFILLGSETAYPPKIRSLFDEIGAKPLWPSSLFAIFGRLFPGSVQAVSPISKSGDDFESQQLGDLKILVAEDNITNQKVVRLLLNRLGIVPDIVDDGLQAAEAAAATAYDVIFLDLQMPVMDGLEASRTIRRQNRQDPPYIVALTANVFQEDRDAAEAAGMNDYLAKPITLERLRDKLVAISKTVAARQPEEPAPPSVPLLDYNQLEPFIVLGIADFLDILGDVLVEVPRRIEEIRAAIQINDTVTLKGRCHSFRGMIGTLGCLALVDRLHRLEYHETVTPAQSAAVCGELETLWEKSLAAIREWEKSIPSLANA